MEFGAVKCSFLLRDCPPLHATWVLTLLSHDVVDLFCGMWIQSVFVIVPKLLLLFILILSFCEMVQREPTWATQPEQKSTFLSMRNRLVHNTNLFRKKIKKCLIGLRRSPPSHGRRREKARKLEKNWSLPEKTNRIGRNAAACHNEIFSLVLFKFPFVMLTVEIEIYSVKNLFLIFFTLTFLFYFYLLKIPSVFCMCIVRIGGVRGRDRRERTEKRSR